jgi:hypothetical protein
MRTRKVHVRVVGRIDAAPGATITIDCANGLVSVRPLRRRREYTVTLMSVAQHIMGVVVRAELADKKRKRGTKVRRGSL